MKKLVFIFCFCALLSCKKEALVVNGTNTEEFNKSIELMERELASPQQPKLHEAIRLITAYEINMDTEELTQSRLRQLLNGKNADEIFTLAERTALKNSIKWDRNTLGTLPDKEFDPIKVQKKDAVKNETQDFSQIENATQLKVEVLSFDKNREDGIKDGLMIFPKLLSADNQAIPYNNLPLEAEVFLSQNMKEIFSRKMSFNNSNVGNPSLRRGLMIPFSAIPSSKVNGDNVELEVRIKTPNQLFRDTETGINFSDYEIYNTKKEQSQEDLQASKDASVYVVESFLKYLNNGELREAHNLSVNNKWRDFNTFSSPQYGFGAVEKIEVNSVALSNFDAIKEKAIVNADYTIQDSVQGALHLNQNFTVQKIGDDWKVVDAKNAP